MFTLQLHRKSNYILYVRFILWITYWNRTSLTLVMGKCSVTLSSTDVTCVRSLNQKENSMTFILSFPFLSVSFQVPRSVEVTFTSVEDPSSRTRDPPYWVTIIYPVLWESQTQDPVPSGEYFRDSLLRSRQTLGTPKRSSRRQRRRCRKTLLPSPTTPISVDDKRVQEGRVWEIWSFPSTVTPTYSIPFLGS